MSGHTHYKYKCVVVSLLLAGVVSIGATPLVRAQETPAQALPDDFAKQQVPSSFPSDETAGAAPKAIDQVDAAVDSSKVPTTPEEQKLVPAQPMGAAAQNAVSGKGAPEEKAATAAVAAPAGQVDPSTTVEPPEGQDILEKYAATSDAADSLPSVDDSAMTGLDDSLMGDSPALGMDGGTAVAVQKTPEELQAEIRSEAFDAAMTGLFPLKPDQITSLLGTYHETQEAIRKPPYAKPTPEVSVQNVSLDPGVMPAVVKTALGNVTTLNILDVTGAPWPVQDVTWAGDFEVIEPEQGGHIIRITPMSQFARGNLVIRLLTLKTPLTMTLESGSDVVQYRIDARIPEYGPFAKSPLMQGGKSLVAGSTDLTAILDGVMPGGMKKLNVSGVDGRTTAYAMGNMTYVRTPLTLLSPAWQSSVSSADGMNVYALTNAPVLLLSDEGHFERATISEKEELLDE